MNPTDLDALILAGGRGTRLRAALPDLPKVLAPVSDKPFVWWLLANLGAQGVRRAVLCTGYAADQVERAIGPRVRNVDVRFSREPAPLGTGGALRAGLHATSSDPVLLVNGDSLLAAPLSAFAAFHHQQGAAASLALAEVADTAQGGRVELDEHARVTAFGEKQRVGPGLVNAGMYLVSRARIKAIEAGHPVSLEHEVLPRWVRAGMFGWRSDGRLLDIGTPARYRQAEGFLKEMGLQ